MTKSEEKLDAIQEGVEKLSKEADKRVGNLNQIIRDLGSNITDTLEEQESAEEQISQLENEIKLLEENIDDEKSAIDSLESRLESLVPDLETKQETKDELSTKITELKDTLSKLEADIEAAKDKKNSLESELEEKQTALADLESSIEDDLESYTSELDEVKSTFDEVLEKNLIWEYLFDKIETPKVEIMAIIAANREISTEEIKEKADGVSPVFVGRAISQLQADEKIVSKGNLWDLSPALLEIVEQE